MLPKAFRDPRSRSSLTVSRGVPGLDKRVNSTASLMTKHVRKQLPPAISSHSSSSSQFVSGAPVSGVLCPALSHPPQLEVG